jgi:hypothetical protein
MKITILTLGTRGDVQPYVALARELMKNGHEPLICTGKSFHVRSALKRSTPVNHSVFCRPAILGEFTASQRLCESDP